MEVPAQVVVQLLMTVVLVVVVPIQVWMLRTIFELAKWRSQQEERCTQHAVRDCQLEAQVPIISQAIVNQGTEILNLQRKLETLAEHLNTRLDTIDKRLEAIEQRSSA